MLTSPQLLKDIFFCPEESDFYAFCIESLVLNNCPASKTIVEFGSGDGSPVIKSLLRTRFPGTVHGFEINNLAYEAAKSKIEAFELASNYAIHNASFFDAPPKAEYLISNPPYLPARDNKIYQPFLHGGLDGITITKKLLSLDYENVLVMIASYSNPESLIDYAITKGYGVANFIVSPLKFGYYSSDPKVQQRITELRKNNQAFYSDKIYMLAGVLFTKQHRLTSDLSKELLQLMTAL
ncbi:methyltransferase [Gloeocapsopsis dulcis]|uniref:SAM-dependent methyltransferase n=1 Tax=Gloeocapsopsis dulcis AAB1 = 1H9 TaxID=1433147 RepID=A0A6N8G0D8_9CHRO|nr:methyltransferase [Gloeocapsopsis dulcis]MUL38045.1 SAM-dependent methyltransferase [Gloeocapsopsis dulcis AAB1 = 1H9]WNN91734.1 methyltransferase [Gloeocapsopsis dulcis]